MALAQETGVPRAEAEQEDARQGEVPEGEANQGRSQQDEAERTQPEPPDREAPAQEGAVEEVVVTGRQQSAATDVLQERIELPVVADLVSAEQISRVGDSTVSLALRRLPGVTLVGDQYIYVRGLGERYSSTTLNGAHVPSPDLTRNVIPLDIFPAEIIESLSITKGYTADQPAAFGGGNIDIRTLAIPDSLLATLQIGSGWDTNSSDEALTYTGGGEDWLGTDDGSRALPAAILDAIGQYGGELSTSSILRSLRTTNPRADPAEAEAINRELAISLNRDIGIREHKAAPDIALEGALGNSWPLGEARKWKVGALGLIDYKNQWRNRDYFRASATFPDQVRSDVQRSIHKVTLTGSLSLGVQYTDEHKVQVGSLYLRNTDDEASIALRNSFNFQVSSGQRLRQYWSRFEERDLTLLQLNGSHALGEETLGLLGDFADRVSFAEDLKLSWHYSDATARTQIPNEVRTDALDRVDPVTGALISTAVRPLISAGDFRFTDLHDDVKSYGVELRQPLELGGSALTWSAGWERYEKDRSYLETQLSLGTSRGGARLGGGPQDVFTDDNIRDPANAFRLDLGGLGTESYLAGESIDAWFAQGDFAWNENWRITSGVRHEAFEQFSTPIDQYGTSGVPRNRQAAVARKEDDYHPALALTYIRPGFWAERFQLRAGWSRTTARPDLREISDATYIDPLTQYRVRGNPQLSTAGLTNYDLRAEWFFENGDNFTVSAFYKHITDPIETVQGAGSDDDSSYTFVNGESAEIRGVELEWLKRLDGLSTWVGDWVSQFFLAGNLTVSHSQITIGDAALGVTHNKHPLSQAAEHVANVQLGFDSAGGRHSATLVFNGTGKRLFFAGRAGAPDAYEQPFNSLDAIYTCYPTEALSFKVRIQNILGDDVSIEQGGVTVLAQDIGTIFKIDATMSFGY